jgi:hypothetical protein
MWDDSSNPYWQHPDEEKPRIDRVFSSMRSHVKPEENVIFLVIKSWNDNIVAYEYSETSSPILTNWISFEPADAAKHKSAGNHSLRSTLSQTENMLFGCSVKVVEGNRFIVHINASQLADKTFELVMNSSGKPMIVGTVNNAMCRLDFAYVQMKKGPLPMGDYMHLYGTNLKTGEKEKEKIMA